MPLSRVASLFSLLALVQAAPQECQRGQDEDVVSTLQTVRYNGHSLQSRSPPPAPPSPGEPCPTPAPPPKCEIAEVQAPRDLLPGAPGHKRPKAATLNDEQAESLPLTNIHFHLGAEHRSIEYNNGEESLEWDIDCNRTGPRPGFTCDSTGIPESQLQPYEFEHCGAYVEVGKTYEIHWVHSSAGYTEEDLNGTDISPIDDGLGGAANGRGQLNPMIAVDAQILLITNGGTDDIDMKVTSWTPDYSTSVMYPGSTTGTSYDNTICSPYAITWHVDKRCYKITAETFDRFCGELKNTFGLQMDLSAHSSRVLVDPAWVAPESFVLPLQ